MQSPRRLRYSCVITAVVLICAAQAIPGNVSTEEDTEILNNATIVDYETARKLAEAAYDKLSYGNGTWQRSAFAGDPNAAGNANDVMDMALFLIRNVIRDKKLDRVAMPDFDEHFESGIIKGTFWGHNGWAESLVSIARKADANIRLDGATVVLSSSVGLDKLQLGMNFAVKVALVKVKGNLDATVASNAVAFEGGLSYSSGKCSLTLRTLKVADLGEIKVKVTGLGVLNHLNSKIVTRVTKKFQDNIRELIENKAKDFLTKALGKLTCPF